MFPLNDGTILMLLLAGSAMVFALSLQARARAVRGGLVLIAAALPWTFLWQFPPVSEFAGLIYLILGGGMIMALLVGGVLGVCVKGMPGAWGVGVILGLTAIFAGVEFWRQYVPETCEGMSVAIGGEVLALPAALGPRLD